MVKPYSLDLRERVVRWVEAGHPVREVAETFGVSVSGVVKWSQRKRQRVSDRLALADVIEDAGTERSKAERVASIMQPHQ